MLAHFANIPIDEIYGMRMPFLQLAGDNTYIAMVAAGLKYDSSWASKIEPGLWPYTLNYASIQECMIGSCPTSSIPAWVQPILNWKDATGLTCAFLDACYDV